MRAHKVAALAVAWTLLLSLPADAGTSDTYYYQLWGLHTVGAEAAWEFSRGEGVLIAVIDTGVDLAHPDLTERLVPGTSVVGEGAPRDEHGHGTLIAGIAAATADNGEGVAGVAPEARILPVRVFDSAGSATSGRVAQAIRFAVATADRRGAGLVLNLSFVGPPQDQMLPGGRPSAIFGDEAVQRAIADAAAAGAVVVTAAGNDGSPHTAFDPPRGRGIIVVGASDRSDQCTDFTNYGEGLDILAPGVSILSTHWNPADGTSSYAYADGTSMAVPFVSGAAALLMASGLDNVATVNRLIETARGPGVSCRDEQHRYGILDVAAAFGVERGEIPRTDPGVPPGPLPSALIVQGAGDDPTVIDPQTQAQAPPAGNQLSDVLRITPIRALAASMVFLVLALMLVARTFTEPDG